MGLIFAEFIDACRLQKKLTGGIRPRRLHVKKGGATHSPWDVLSQAFLDEP